MKNKILLIIGCLCFGLTACETTTVQTVEQIAVTYSVAKVTENNPTLGPSIVLVCDEVSALLDGNPDVTLLQLREFVLGKIAASTLSKADRVLVTTLLDTIDANLRARISVGALPPDKVVKVKTVLAWVKAGAKA